MPRSKADPVHPIWRCGVRCSLHGRNVLEYALASPVGDLAAPVCRLHLLSQRHLVFGYGAVVVHLGLSVAIDDGAADQCNPNLDQVLRSLCLAISCLLCSNDIAGIYACMYVIRNLKSVK